MSLVRVLAIGIGFLAVSARAELAPLKFQGKVALRLFTAAQSLAKVSPITGLQEVDGELLLQKKPGRLGGLDTISYGFVMVVGDKAFQVRFPPAELIDAVKAQWPNQAPFESDNLWRVKAPFKLEAKAGDEAATVKLALTYPTSRSLKVQCNSQDHLASPFLFNADVTASEGLDRGTLGAVKVINFLKAGAHIEDGGKSLYPPGAFDAKDGNLKLSWNAQKQVMELAAEWPAGSQQLTLSQDADDKGDVYAGTLELSADGKPLTFTVQCQVSRNY